MAALTLDDFVAQTRAAYGGALHAIVLYGSAARATAAPARGPYDVLVVADAISLEALRRVTPTARAWAEAGNPRPLTLTLAEWRSSADIFPMEYADVLDAHRVLAGELPTEGIVVDPADLRRQAEQQTLGALLQLRGAIVAAGGDAKRRLALLDASFSTILVLFRTLARLHGESPPSDPEALVRWAGGVAGFDDTPFVAVARHRRATTSLTTDAADATLVGYLAGLERLVAHLDALPVRG